MNLKDEIEQIYDSRNYEEKRSLDIVKDIFGLVDSDLLLIGDNHSSVNNDKILEISLQHKHDNDRLVLFLFQPDFLELYFDSYSDFYEYPDIFRNNELQEDFKALVFNILDGSYKHVEYYKNGKLIKYTTIWDDDFILPKTVYTRTFGKLRDKFSKQILFEIREKRCVSFFKDLNS